MKTADIELERGEGEGRDKGAWSRGIYVIVISSLVDW